MTDRVSLTGDGSHTILSGQYGVPYHSIHGAITESLHVFIAAGLEHLLLKQDIPDVLNVLEIGFGTGLNALLTLDSSNRTEQSIDYTGIEPNPLAQAQLDELNYLGQENLELYFDEYRLMHTVGEGQSLPVSPNFRFSIIRQSLQQASLPAGHFNLVYYDAFAPTAQPEMWTVETLEIVARAMHTDGVLVTYCAQGQFKRNLRALGFDVESIPGPPGKREMVRATLTT